MLDEGVRAGLEHLGQRSHVVAYVERDAFAAATMLTRMEEQSMEPAPIWCGDAGELELELEPFAGRVAGIVAGFPCQPWSLAGEQRGEDDERWLWPLIRRAHCALRSGFMFLENVPGLVSGGGLAAILGDLARLGLDAEWCRVRARDVGAAHERERIFILAHAGGAGLPRRQLGRAPRGEHRRQTPRPVAQLCAPHLFAPGPEDSQWWAADRPGHLDPETQPGLRLLVDGVAVVVDASRADQIRGAGNGVVALQAAIAFVHLARRVTG